MTTQRTIRQTLAAGAGIFRPAPTFVPRRFGRLSGDEHFVSAAAAQQGVTIINRNSWEPLVVLKHFGPNHPEMPKAPSD